MEAIDIFRDAVDLGENPSMEKLIKTTYEAFRDRWKTSYDYTKHEPVIFTSNQLGVGLLQSEDFKRVLYYGYYVFRQSLDNAAYVLYCDATESTLKLDSIVAKEIINWDKNGGACIYISILIYCLLVQNGLVREENINYTQGYYEHPLRKDFPSIIPANKTQYGIHTWLNIDGKVIDLTIAQQRLYYDLGETDYMLGNIPKDFVLVGYNESPSLVKSYARDIAKKSGMTYYDWIKYHNKQSFEILKNK